MAKIVLRVPPDTGELNVLERAPDGKFEFGDPKHGDEKHHSSKHRVEADSIAEALELIGAGFHPRMRGRKTGQFNMISPGKVIILDVPE